MSFFIFDLFQFIHGNVFLEILVIFIVLCLLYVGLLGEQREFEPLRFLAGPKTRWPLFGDINLFWNYNKSISEVLPKTYAKLTRTYAKEGICRVYVGAQPVVYTYKPSLAEAAISQGDLAERHEEDFLYDIVCNAMTHGASSALCRNSESLEKIFNNGVIPHFSSVVNRHSESLMEILKRDPVQDNMEKLLRKLSLDIVMEVSLGINANALSEEKNELLDNFELIRKRQIERYSNPLFWPNVIYDLTTSAKEYKESKSFVRKYIKEAIRSGADPITGNGQQTIFSLWLKHTGTAGLLENNVLDHAEQISAAAIEIITSALLWTLQHVGNNESVQEKLHNEIETVLGDDPNRGVEEVDIKEMHYLDCVVRESLRLSPPIAWFGYYVADDTHVGKDKIPIGAIFCVLTYYLNRDPDTYSEPENFIPERFQSEEGKKRHTSEYCIFSPTVHVCVAQRFALLQIKLVLANILRRFRVKSLRSTPEVGTCFKSVLFPRDAIRMKYTPKKI